MILRLAASILTLTCASVAVAHDAAAPTPQLTCADLDAKYAKVIPQLDEAVDEAVAVARKESTRRNWATAKEAHANLAASEADYETLHTKQACSSRRFALLEPWERQQRPNATVKPFLLQFTNSAATTAGIGVLKDLDLPEGETEIRIWIGFGIVEPNEMLRIRVNSSEDVTGDVLRYFSHDYARRILAGSTAEDVLEMWNNVAGGCSEIREGAVDDTCFAKPERLPDWRAVNARLVGLGVESLPDEDELPADDVTVFDGVAMVVEVRKGSRYRAYEYSNPSFHEQSESQAAAEIIKLAVSTMRGATD